MDVRAVGALMCCLTVLCGMGLAGGVGAVPSTVGTPGDIASSPSDAAGTPLDLDSTSFDSVALDTVGQENQTDDSGSDENDTVTNGTEANETDDEHGNETDDGSEDDETGNETGEQLPSLSGYDEILVEITVQENGTATWVEEYRYRLDEDDNQSVNWSSLQGDVENNSEEYVEEFAQNRYSTIETAQNQTQRSMDASGFSVETDETSTPQEYGYVRFTFEWSSLAHVEVNRIDLETTLDGFVMDDRTMLRIAWPEEYVIRTIEPEPDDRRETSVTWHGDATEFVDGEPRLELIQNASNEGNADGDGDDETAGTNGVDSWQSPWWLIGVALFVLGVVSVGRWILARDDRSADSSSTSSTSDSVPVSQGPGSVGPPEHLLSNEERVMRLLEEHGGRMKQQEVVAELDWTEAKTSQVVSELRQSDTIDVFRIGRENVLTIADSSTTDENEPESAS